MGRLGCLTRINIPSVWVCGLHDVAAIGDSVYDQIQGYLTDLAMNTDSREFAYSIKARLVGSKPSIWRALCVPGEISLDRLNDVVQIVMDWKVWRG